LAILIGAGLLALTIVTGKFGRILDFLYSPYAAFLAVVMIAEYVIVKGADRSSLYRRGMEAAREKRQEDLLTFRAMETVLHSVREDVSKLGEIAADSDTVKQAQQTEGAADARPTETDEAAQRLSENVDLLLDQLRSRI